MLTSDQARILRDLRARFTVLHTYRELSATGRLFVYVDDGYSPQRIGGTTHEVAIHPDGHVSMGGLTDARDLPG
jgi:hypothetical protein